MALNVLAHWSLNEPSNNPSRVWDNSGNGYHGDFEEIKPVVVEDSPCGSRSMQWVEGSGVVLPTVSGVEAVSYWIKEDGGSWKFIVVSEGKQYENNEQVGDKTVSDAINSLHSMMLNEHGFSLSDIFYFESALSEADRDRLYTVKASISAENVLRGKEYVEGGDKVSVGKTGIISAKNLEIKEGSVGFGKTGLIHAVNVIEN